MSTPQHPAHEVTCLENTNYLFKVEIIFEAGFAPGNMEEEVELLVAIDGSTGCMALGKKGIAACHSEYRKAVVAAAS